MNHHAQPRHPQHGDRAETREGISVRLHKALKAYLTDKILPSSACRQLRGDRNKQQTIDS
jgi:hypothetical protein